MKNYGDLEGPVIRLDLHYSSNDTQPHSKIVKYWSLLFIQYISSFLVKITRLSCFGSENKNVPTFYSFHQQEDNSKGDICYLENIL